MKDVWTKTRILLSLVRAAVRDWYIFVRQHDLNTYACCSGGSGSHDICGCGGATLRDIYGP